ncbi:hypothetical protein [Streptomyces sp. NPDC059757]|uniref:hypothetical protein n=1 Tax=Streptomyces sp. NPDC059757 TaxID=3346935 RepID=UPI003654A1A7
MKATSNWVGWVILAALCVGGWFLLGFLKDLIFGPGFPHELSQKDAYVFGRVIVEDEGDGTEALMVCSTVLTLLERDVPDAFEGGGTRADFLEGCAGNGPSKYDFGDSYRFAVHDWMENTPAP